MKIAQPTVAPTSQPQAGKQPFSQVLETAKAVDPRKPLAAHVRPAQPVVAAAPPRAQAPKQVVSTQGTSAPQAVRAQAHEAQKLASTAARQRVEHEAERLADVRAHHHEVAATQEANATIPTSTESGKRLSHLLGLVLRELESEAPLSGRPAANQDARLDPESLKPPSIAPVTPTPRPAPTAAELTQALVERIESFVRGTRPALQLTLGASMGSKVEIERLGHKEIAVTLIGRNGPPSAEVVSRIREELQARGLKVAALSVG